MQKTFLAWFVVLGVGCHTAPTVAVEASAPAASAVVASLEPAKPAIRRPAPITPQIVAKATELLGANDSAKIGTEFPFEMDGKRYVARLEVHDNPDGDPNRPLGEHKGITIYVLEE
jgi:hypothetical protein